MHFGGVSGSMEYTGEEPAKAVAENGISLQVVKLPRGPIVGSCPCPTGG